MRHHDEYQEHIDSLEFAIECARRKIEKLKFEREQLKQKQPATKEAKRTSFHQYHSTPSSKLVFPYVFRSCMNLKDKDKELIFDGDIVKLLTKSSGALRQHFKKGTLTRVTGRTDKGSGIFLELESLDGIYSTTRIPENVIRQPVHHY